MHQVSRNTATVLPPHPPLSPPPLEPTPVGPAGPFLALLEANLAALTKAEKSLFSVQSSPIGKVLGIFSP